MKTTDPIDTTPCGHRPEDSDCALCRQYACRVFQDRPAPKREIPAWLRNAVGLKMVDKEDGGN